MRFGPARLDEAAGHVLAHGRRAEGRRIAKGTLLGKEEIDALRRAGIDEVVVARLEEGDVPEDEAAEALARAATGPGLRLRGPFTGRCNLLAEAPGVAVIDAGAVRRANAVDESLTLATVAPWAPVREDGLVVTAKVIPLAVAGTRLDRAVGILREAAPVVRVAPFRPARAALVLTELPGSREGLLEKAEEVTRRRLEALGSTLATVRRCPHEPAALAGLLEELSGGGHDVLLVMGASAVVDRADVVPLAVQRAGGEVDRLGIPVDPGNLLLLARLGDAPVLGIPGCARSPRRNGFDAVLERVLAGVPPGDDEMAALGVGGLLAEIPSRPQPREGSAEPAGQPLAGVAAVVLAAGRSSRMGAGNKLVARVGGETLVARAVDAALEAGVASVVVVTGHGAAEVEEALKDRPVGIVHNPRADAGMSTSLAAGLEALDRDGLRGVLVALGDMPAVRPSTLRALGRALDPDAGRSVCVPVYRNKRGNPVLWAARFVPDLCRLEGDVGGRAILGRYPEEVFEVEVDDPGVLLDVDTPEALQELEGLEALEELEELEEGGGSG